MILEFHDVSCMFTWSFYEKKLKIPNHNKSLSNYIVLTH